MIMDNAPKAMDAQLENQKLKRAIMPFHFLEESKAAVLSALPALLPK